MVGLEVQPLAREDSGCCSCHSVLREVRSSGGLSAYLSHAMSSKLEHILGPHFNVLSRDVTAVHPSRKHLEHPARAGHCARLRGAAVEKAQRPCLHSAGRLMQGPQRVHRNNIHSI